MQKYESFSSFGYLLWLGCFGIPKQYLSLTAPCSHPVALQMLLPAHSQLFAHSQTIKV